MAAPSGSTVAITSSTGLDHLARPDVWPEIAPGEAPAPHLRPTSRDRCKQTSTDVSPFPQFFEAPRTLFGTATARPGVLALSTCECQSWYMDVFCDPASRAPSNGDAGMKLTLRSPDIQRRHDIVVPGAWAGEMIDVMLEGGALGRLQTIYRVDPNTWHMRWRRSGSPLDGRTFELARMISTIHALGRQPDWNCRLALVDREEAPQAINLLST